MKKRLVLKKILISNFDSQRLLGGTGGNSLDDETNTNPTYLNCPDTEQPNCSGDPRKCMVDPPTHPY